MARIKQENPSSPMKEVMSILGQEWKEHKALQTDMGSPETRSGGLGGLMDDLKVWMPTLNTEVLAYKTDSFE